MNWGKGITIAIIAFMTFIVVLIVNLMSKNVDLEYEDYYMREVSYSDRITAESNGLPFVRTTRVQFTEDALVILLPDDFPAVDSGLVHFYRPDNAGADVRMELTNEKEQFFPIRLFKSGRYEIRMEWIGDGKPYFLKKTVFVQ